MAILFASSEDIDFGPVGTPRLVTGSGANEFDPAYARCALVGYSTEGWRLTLEAPQTELWFQARINWDDNDGYYDNPVVIFRDTGLGQGLFRLRQLNAVLRLEYWDSAAWQLGADTGLVPTPDTLNKVTIRLKIADAGGEYTLYYNDTELGSVTGDTNLVAGINGIDQIDLLGAHASFPSTSDYVHFSEVLVTQAEDPRPMRVRTLVPNGPGSAGQWSGDYTAIDEAKEDQADLISSAAAGEVEQMSLGDLPAGLTGRYPAVVIVSAKARRGASGPQSLQLGLRTGGADHWSASKALGESFAVVRERWTQNPETLADWTNAEVDALEIGLKSVL